MKKNCLILAVSFFASFLISCAPEADGESRFASLNNNSSYVNCQYGNSCRETTRQECDFLGGWEVPYCQSNGGGMWTIPSQAITLTANQWREGSVTSSFREAWYSFYATAGTTYYILWDDSHSGPHSYNLDVMVSAYDSYGYQLFERDDTDEGESITVYSSGTVYIKVVALSEGNTGSFGIKYSTYSAPQPDETMEQAISLTSGQWREGSITSSFREAWYSFYATAGTTYYILWDDSHSGPRSYNLDVVVSAYDSYGYQLFERDDTDEGESITVYSSGMVYIKVVAFSGGNTGHFGIKYSTYSAPPPPDETYVNCRYSINSCFGTTRHECLNYYGGVEVSSCQSNDGMYQAISLTSGQWREGSITSSAREAWYSFYATAGTTYYIWWDDRYSGLGSYDLDVVVSAYDSYGDQLFEGDDTDEGVPITLYSSGTVYIKVVALSEGDSGAFGIVYSTSSYMPW